MGPPIFRMAMAASALPESVVNLTVRLAILHSIKKMASMTPYEDHGSLYDGQLDGAQDVADVVVRLSRPEQQMDMLGHDHVGPDMECIPGTCPIDSLGEPQPTAILAQKRLAAGSRRT
jgi:hypothetical protein